jgi:tRNA U38,U39,U40 pseudouridine synthase TruA
MYQHLVIARRPLITHREQPNMNVRLSIAAVSACTLLAFSVGVDARQCANGKGYRYVNGEQVCPEDYSESQRWQMNQEQELRRLKQNQQQLEADIQRQQHDLKWRELGIER